MSRQEIRRIYRTAKDEDLPLSLKLVIGDMVFEYSKVLWRVERTRTRRQHCTDRNNRRAGLEKLIG